MKVQPFFMFLLFMVLVLENNLEGKFLLIEVKNAVEIGVNAGRSQGIYLLPLQTFNIMI